MDLDEIKRRLDELDLGVDRLRAKHDEMLTAPSSDGESKLLKARKLAEMVCKYIYVREGLEESTGRKADKMRLKHLLGCLNKEGVLPDPISAALGAVHRYGNFSAHDQGKYDETITPRLVEVGVQNVSVAAKWLLGIDGEATSRMSAASNRHPAHERLWNSLREAEKYIQMGISEQLKTTRSSFSGNDMRPVIAAYQTLRDLTPVLPGSLVGAAMASLETAQDGLNRFLDILRAGVRARDEGQDAAPWMQTAMEQLETTLARYREDLDKVAAIIRDRGFTAL